MYLRSCTVRDEQVMAIPYTNTAEFCQGNRAPGRDAQPHPTSQSPIVSGLLRRILCYCWRSRPDGRCRAAILGGVT